MITNLQYRFAGRSAIASGVAGILAAVFLMIHFSFHGEDVAQAVLFLKFREGLAVLQFLLLIPVVIALYHVVQKRTDRVERNTLTIGIGALVTAALFAILAIPGILSDLLYFFPQGVFGGWLIFIGLRLKGQQSKGLIRLGIAIGTMLAIGGIFPIGYALFVDTIILQIPAPNDALKKVASDMPAHSILHTILVVGVIGVLLLPVWTIWTGVKLLREKINP